MSGRVRNGQKQLRDTNRPRKTMKILSGTRFQWIAYNTETQKFMGKNHKDFRGFAENPLLSTDTRVLLYYVVPTVIIIENLPRQVCLFCRGRFSGAGWLKRKVLLKGGLDAKMTQFHAFLRFLRPFGQVFYAGVPV